MARDGKIDWIGSDQSGVERMRGERTIPYIYAKKHVGDDHTHSSKASTVLLARSQFSLVVL